jgi:hypothetical protein
MKNQYTYLKLFVGCLIIAALSFFLSQSSQAASPEPAETVSAAEDSFVLALQNGEYFLHTRTFYFKRSFDLPDVANSEAFTAGGIVKYESARYHGFKFALAPYGSFSLFGIVDRELGGGSGLLQPDGDDISFLGEAYLDFAFGRNQFTLGWQQLDTPLMGKHDIRMLPTVYEGAVFRNTSLAHTLLELGYVSKYSGFTSSLNGFEEDTDAWGTEGLGYIFVTTDFRDATLRGEFIQTIEESGSMDNFVYLDGKVLIPLGDTSYIKGQFGTSAYQEGDTAVMFGAMTGTTLFQILDIALLFNKITDNKYATVQGGPMYSDYQQGYGNYEPSQALGGQLILHPFKDASILLGYVDVTSEDGDEFHLDTYQETILDLNYSFTEGAKIRVRYSVKNQDASSEREDREDFRVIFDFNF